MGEKTEAEDPRKKQQSARHQRHQARQRNVPRAPGIGDQCGANHGRRRGVGSDHQMPRRAEDGERQQRQQKRVEPGDYRGADNLRIAHHLGNSQRGQRDARHDFRNGAERFTGRIPWSKENGSVVAAGFIQAVLPSIAPPLKPSPIEGCSKRCLLNLPTAFTMKPMRFPQVLHDPILPVRRRRSAYAFCCGRWMGLIATRHLLRIRSRSPEPLRAGQISVGGPRVFTQHPIVRVRASSKAAFSKAPA